MFPNFCFTQCAKDQGYHVVKRTYVPKDSNKASDNSTGIESRNGYMLRPSHPSSETLDTFRDQNGKRLKRVVRRIHKENPVSARRTGQETMKKEATRSVNFFVSPLDCQELQHQQHRAASGAEEPRRRNSGQTGAENKHQPVGPPKDPNQELQESCADFFNIVHDNVLEAVQGAVERMVFKYFEDTMTKVDRLAAQLSHNEKLLTEMYRDLISKIADQNETSINQFKFVAQMLIDSQTIHYRALQSQHQRYKRTKSEESNDSDSVYREQESNAGDGQIIQIHKAKQHQLKQQQQPNVYSAQMCQKCSPPGSSRERRLPSKPTTIRRLPKNNGSASLPNLQRRISCPTVQATGSAKLNQRSPTRQAGSRHPSTHRFYSQPSQMQTNIQARSGQSQPVSRSSSAVRRKLRCRHAMSGPSAEDMAVQN
ncbi:uncharacterized protein LOC115624097 [Scaptodrosophila lebanonensis]|uniref:Uncharacterized protein LOC115624097 n=1 Tax=Drosophila lebanonensis TaxID=7225 RepID=A0A6J2TCM6_DROLE|nr:uncharacterized protein LOC115624097 [Scaptodrosophila lebanonensis]